MNPETSVIILNWNGARLLPACLSALGGQSYRDFDLWLVDNGSIDESARLLDDLEKSLQPDWMSAPLPRPPKIIRNRQNVGFAAGNNLAMRQTHSRSRYVVLLNNDAIAEPDWLGELVSAADVAPPQVGFVASTMFFSHLPQVVASAGISVHRDGVALDRGLGLPSVELEQMGMQPVFGASGGAVLYKAAMLRDVGLFDERFFSYLEDADLAWRARSRGWRALHNPRAKVLHEYSATGGHGSPFKKHLVSRNRVWLLYKNMPEPLLRRYWPLIARYDALVVLNAVLTRDSPVLKGRAEAVSRLGQLTRSRRETICSARLHPDEVGAMLSPALSPRRMLKYRKRLGHLLYVL